MDAAPRPDAPARPGRIAWTDAPALLAFAACFFGQPLARVDDAFIFYRYAANWAAGLGPVFNPGERVEGFSSELWTAMLALAAKCGWAPHLAGPALGFACTVVALLLLGHATRRLLPGRTLLHVLVPLGAALSASVVFYAASGMDTPLFAAVLLASALAAATAIERDEWRALAACVPLLALVRAEGLAYAGLVLVATVPAAARRGRASLRRWGGVAGFALATAAALLAARAAYFGDALPASMRSKAVVSHTLGELLAGRGGARPLLVLLAHGVRHQMLVLPLLVLPLAALALRFARRREVPALAWTLLCFVPFATAISIVAAGDWMPYHRHGAAVWGMVLLVLAWAGAELGGRRATAVAALVLVAGAWRGAEGVPRLGNPLALTGVRPAGMDAWHVSLGRTLAGLRPAPVVVANMVGQFAYYGGPGLYVRDVLGLTDPHNAREGDDWSPTYGRTDIEYTFGTPCDVLLTTTALDLMRLRQHARDASGAPRRFVLHAAPAWLEDRFLVATAEGSPATEAVAALAGATPVPLDSATTAIVRRSELAATGWELRGLPRAIAQANGAPR